MRNIIVFILFFPTLALASGGDHHGAPGIETLVWPGINFVIYVAVMSYFYRKLGRPALIGKAHSVKEQIEKAEGALSAARNDLELVQRRDIELEKNELKDRIIGEGRMQAASIVEDAQALLRKLERDIELRINRDFGKVEEEFRTEVVRKASKLVRDEFLSSLSEVQDQELRKDALRSVLN